MSRLMVLLSAVVLAQSVAAQVPKGTTRNEYLFSKLLNVNTKYVLYLPPNYTQSTARYPVVYVVQGPSAEWSSADNMALIDVYNTKGDGVQHPVMGVWTDVDGSEHAQDDCGSPTESYFITELIPHIDSTYRTIPSRFGRGISGHSKGGGGCVRIALKYPTMFSACIPMDGWPSIYDYRTPKHYGGVACPSARESYWNFIRYHFGLIEKMPIQFLSGTMFAGEAVKYSAYFTELGMKDASVVDAQACGHAGFCNSSQIPDYFGLFESQFARGALPPPSISPAGDPQKPWYEATVKVTITGASPKDLIYYTLDGTKPSRLSRQYTGPFDVSRSTVVYARSYNESATDSSVGVYAEYRILTPSQTVQNTFPGIAYSLYEGKFGKVRDVPTTAPKSSTVLGSPVPPKTDGRVWGLACRMSGYLRITAPGAYYLYEASDGPTAILVDSQIVVRDDTTHGMREYAGMVWLSRGDHRIDITSCTGGSNLNLVLRWESPANGIALEPIPSSVLRNVVQAVGVAPKSLSPISRRIAAAGNLYTLQGRPVVNRNVGLNAWSRPRGLFVSETVGKARVSLY